VLLASVVGTTADQESGASPVLVRVKGAVPVVLVVWVKLGFGVLTLLLTEISVSSQRAQSYGTDFTEVII